MNQQLNQQLVRTGQLNIDSNGKVSADTHLADLLVYIFNHDGVVQPAKNLADAIRQHAIDDIDFAAAALDGDCGLSHQAVRIMNRSHDWLEVANQIEQRLVEAEATEPAEKPVFPRGPGTTRPAEVSL